MGTYPLSPNYEGASKMPRVSAVQINALTVADITRAVESYDKGDRVWEPWLDVVSIYLELHDKKYPACFIVATAIALKYPLCYEKGMDSKDVAGFSNMFITKLKKLAFIITIDESKRKKRRTKKEVEVDKFVSAQVSTPLEKPKSALNDRISTVFGINGSNLDDYYESLPDKKPTAQTMPVPTIKRNEDKESFNPHLIEAYKQLILEGKI